MGSVQDFVYPCPQKKKQLENKQPWKSVKLNKG